MNVTEGSTGQPLDHKKERAAVIKEYGSLWQQAIAKSGVTDQKVTDELLQVCAACYLDGVHRGSVLALEVIANNNPK